MDVVFPAENDGSFQLSMYQKIFILRLLGGFVIKFNLNKIITLLFINWKLVRFYRYTLIVLQEMQNSREIFGGMEVYQCELEFKGKIKE